MGTELEVGRAEGMESDSPGPEGPLVLRATCSGDWQSCARRGREAPAPAGNWLQIQTLGLTLDLLNQKPRAGYQDPQAIFCTLRLHRGAQEMETEGRRE